MNFLTENVVALAAIAVSLIAVALSEMFRRRLRGGHRYLSTGCLHGRHDYCKNTEGRAGTKRPAECKFCQAKCLCSCHTEDS